MLIIRFSRTGKKHQPLFRIVLAEKHKHPSKKFLEILATFNPRNKEFVVKNEERIKYWLGKNVQVSPTVHNLFVGHKLVEGAKVEAWRPKKKAKSESGTSKTQIAKEASEEIEAQPEVEQKTEEEQPSVADEAATRVEQKTGTKTKEVDKVDEVEADAKEGAAQQ